MSVPTFQEFLEYKRFLKEQEASPSPTQARDALNEFRQIQKEAAKPPPATRQQTYYQRHKDKILEKNKSDERKEKISEYQKKRNAAIKAGTWVPSKKKNDTPTSQGNPSDV